MPISLVLAALAAAPAAPAPAPPEAASSVRVDDEYAELVAAYEAAREEHKQAIRAEQDPAKRRLLRRETAEKEFLPRFEALVEGGDGRGNMWIARHAGRAGLPREEARARKAAAWRALAHDHLEAPWLGEAVDLIKRHRADVGRDTAIGYLEHVYKKTPQVEVRARCAHMLALVFERSKDEKEQAAAARWLEIFESDYADSAYRKSVLAEEAALEAAREAAANQGSSGRERPKPSGLPDIGDVAPDFTGETVDGEPVRLSDHRGKIVVLDFFGFWCPPCRKELPVLAALAEEHADDPFVLLGINTGDSEGKFREGAKEYGVTWPCIVQGLAEAPISDRYGIRSYPTVFVLDAEGKVRARVRGERIAAAVAELLAELEEDEDDEGGDDGGDDEDEVSGGRAEPPPGP